MTQTINSTNFIEEIKLLLFSASQSSAFSHSSNLLDFYSLFISEQALLSADIYSYEKIYGKDLKPFTVYNIKIKTKTHEFRLAKRYNEFSSFYEKMKKKYPELIKDWHFPEKTMFWGTFNNEILETRRRNFQEFLEILINRYAGFNATEFLDFLEIQKIFHANNRLKIKGGVSATINGENNRHSIVNSDKKKEKQNLTESIEQEKIFQFLWNLNYSTDNYITVFNDYETYFLTSKPKLNLDSIKRLLLGDKSLRGLIDICGVISNPDTNDNLHHICSKAFKFLSILLDFEYNKEAEIYIKVYKSANIALVSALKLQHHMEPNSQKQCKFYALRLLDVFHSQNQEKTLLNLPLLLANNEEAIREYEKWKSIRRFSSISSENFETKNFFSPGDSMISPLSFLSSKLNTIQRKSIPLTKWLPIPMNETKNNLFKLKHLNKENLKLSTYIKGNYKDCFAKLINEQAKWDKLFESFESYMDANEELLIERINYCNEKKFMFIHKRIIEKTMNEIKLIKTFVPKPADLKMKEDEVLLVMNVNFIVKTAGTAKKRLRNLKIDGDLTKIKVILKEMNSETKEAFQNELNGTHHKFLDNLVNFKNFVEGSGRQL